MIETDDRDNWEYYILFFKSLKHLLDEPEGASNTFTMPLEEGPQELVCGGTFSTALDFMEGLLAKEKQVTANC